MLCCNTWQSDYENVIWYPVKKTKQLEYKKRSSPEKSKFSCFVDYKIIKI